MAIFTQYGIEVVILAAETLPDESVRCRVRAIDSSDANDPAINTPHCDGWEADRFTYELRASDGWREVQAAIDGLSEDDADQALRDAGWTKVSSRED